MKETKNVFSKAGILACTLGLGLGMLAPAAPAIAAIDNGSAAKTLTVDGLDTEGHATADVYKILKVNWDFTRDQPTEPMYTWESGVADWVKGNYPAYINASDNSVTKAFEDTILSDDGSLNADRTPVNNGAAVFYDELAKAIKTSDGVTITPITSTVDTTNGTVSANLTANDMGSYLTLISGNKKSYRPVVSNLLPEYDDTSNEWTLNDALSTAKATDVTIAKVVDDAQTHVGQNVEFTISLKVPVYPANAINNKFVLKDTLPAGLDLDVDSVKVFDGSSDITTTAIRNKEFNTRVLTVDFNQPAIQQYSNITVKYTAKVNEDATIGTAGSPNKAEITYASDPYGTDTFTEGVDDAIVNVYTYGMKIHKVDEAGTLGLAGATFKISHDGADLKFNGSNGVFTLDDGQDGGDTELTCDDNGVLSVQGLEPGDYTVTELQAPNGGYAKLQSPVTFTITDNDGDGAVDENADTDANNGFISVNIKNVKSWTAPRTGGIAGLIALGGGAAITIGYGLLKKSKNEQE